MSKLKCIDDSFKPADIPTSMWVKRGVEYTPVNSFKDMNGVLLYQLEEIDLTTLGTSYKGFAASRFKVVRGNDDELLEQLINELESTLENA